MASARIFESTSDKYNCAQPVFEVKLNQRYNTNLIDRPVGLKICAVETYAA
jgi:hypothetical protein